jgi:hypothetical protein
MRRLNPILERRLCWIASPALIWLLCLASSRLIRLVGSDSRYRKPLEGVLWNVEACGLFLRQIALCAGVYLVYWLACSIKKNGVARTVFFDPALAQDYLESRRAPMWLFFILRAVILIWVLVAISDMVVHPHVPEPESQADYRNLLIILPCGFMTMFLPFSALRYRRVGVALSAEKPELQDDLDGPEGLSPVKPPSFHIDRERMTEAWWNVAVIAHRSHEAEGTLADGSAFSIKIEYRMPWFQSARFAAILRVKTEEKRAVAILSAGASTLFPAEASADMEPVLSEAQAFLLPRGSSSLVVTTRYVQASLPRISSVTEAFEAAGLGLRIQANFQASREGGYRGDSPLAAAPAEIARVEAIAEEAWAAFPRSREDPGHDLAQVDLTKT